MAVLRRTNQRLVVVVQFTVIAVKPSDADSIAGLLPVMNRRQVTLQKALDNVVQQNCH